MIFFVNMKHTNREKSTGVILFTDKMGKIEKY